MASRRSEKSTPVPRPVVGETPPATGSWPLTFTFRGYVAAGFRVDDPTTADLGSDTAYVHPVSEPAGGAGAATLRVYHGGVDPTLGGGGPSKVPTDPIGGRAAYFIRPPQSTSVELLRQYSATGFAVLTAGRSALTDEQMRQLAAAFSPGVVRPAQIGFATTRIPPGYRLIRAYGAPAADVRDAATSGATFVLASAAKAMAAQPDRDVPPENRSNPDYSFTISLGRWNSSYPQLKPRGVTCEPAKGGATCYRLIDLGNQGDYVLTATSAGSTTEPLSAALTSTQLAALNDATTWWEVNRAFPASAQLPG